MSAGIYTKMCNVAMRENQQKSGSDFVFPRIVVKNLSNFSFKDTRPYLTN